MNHRFTFFFSVVFASSLSQPARSAPSKWGTVFNTCMRELAGFNGIAGFIAANPHTVSNRGFAYEEDDYQIASYKGGYLLVDADGNICSFHVPPKTAESIFSPSGCEPQEEQIISVIRDRNDAPVLFEIVKQRRQPADYLRVDGKNETSSPEARKTFVDHLIAYVKATQPHYDRYRKKQEEVNARLRRDAAAGKLFTPTFIFPPDPPTPYIKSLERCREATRQLPKEFEELDKALVKQIQVFKATAAATRKPPRMGAPKSAPLASEEQVPAHSKAE